MTATIQDPSGAYDDTTWTAISTDFYRYYTPEETGGYSGGDGLMYVVTGPAYAQLQTAATVPLT
jgi:hypothetical protein